MTHDPHKRWLAEPALEMSRALDSTRGITRCTMPLGAHNVRRKLTPDRVAEEEAGFLEASQSRFGNESMEVKTPRKRSANHDASGIVACGWLVEVL